MAETTGSATDLEDLIAKFLTWVATVPGWTVNQSISTIDSGRQCAFSKGNLFAQMRWASASPQTVAIYQSTAFNAATRAGSMTGDSGNGYNTNNSTTEANLTSERCVQTLGNNAIPNYYFYTNAAGDYLHVVAEVNTDEFRHFGFGNLEKFADWDTMAGGEYAYGQVFDTSSSSTGSGQGALLDGAATLTTTTSAMNDRGATMRLAGAPNQAGASIWAHVWGRFTGVTENTDTAGNARATVMGGFRGGPMATALQWIKAGSSSGLAPTIPISCWHIDRSTSPNRAILLGFMPDVRTVHMRYLSGGDTFTLGADTWRAFPTVRRVEGGTAGDTDFQGIAYNTTA